MCLLNSRLYIGLFLLTVLCYCLVGAEDTTGTQKIGVPRSPAAPLPDKLLIAYANWNECDSKIIEAVINGANVVMWFSINLATSTTTGEPEVVGGPNYSCVANITYQLREVYKLSVVNMITVGGWNSPHPTTDHPVEEVYLNWKKWNTETIANPELGFYGFDGIDWDLEGNDDFSNANNIFTISCLDLIGKFSQMAKQDGFYVSMAPCESYLDPTQPHFDRYVNHTYPEWDRLVPNFYYHGHNTYSYILEKYGRASTSFPASLSVELHTSEIDTFDWIAMQLYEGYSHAEYNITILSQSPSDYLPKYVQSLSSGWSITPAAHNTDLNTAIIEAIPSNPNNINEISPADKYEINGNHEKNEKDVTAKGSSYFMQVPLDKLVVGLGNGWAANPLGKFLFLDRDAIHSAYRELSRLNILPRGFMYWDIADEGVLVDGKPYYLSVILNEVMRIRPIPVPTPNLDPNPDLG